MKIKLYPIEELESSVEFLTVLSALYINSHGKSKFLFTEVLYNLLEPIAGIARAEVNFPGWYTLN